MVTFHDEFDPEFDALSQDVQEQLLAAAHALRQLGPRAGRPRVGALKNPRHPNMKELRFSAHNGAEIWRATFAFDPNRHAIILVAAEKQGVDQDRFYRELLSKANDRYDRHLAALNAVEIAKATKGGKGSKRR
jgi:hypothetical protein